MTRGVTWWTDEKIKLIKDHFVAVSVPTWTCRAAGPEGEFLRAAGIDKHWVTSSGYMSCVSASGRLLGRAPSPQVLDAFQELPESERKPGAVSVPEIAAKDRLIPSPPEGGLVLRVHARFLARDGDGQLRRAQTDDFPLMRDNPNIARAWRLFLQPNTEYMWLTQNEWQAFAPANPRKGQSIDVPASVAQRMARFHLTPQRATTSEGGVIPPQAVKQAELQFIVTDASTARIQLEIQGRVHWGSEFDALLATSPNGPLRQGFATRLYGRAEYDRVKNRFTRLDIIAPGEVWGRWGDANGKSMYVERPGREPFGFVFELATGETPSDKIPPGGNGRYVETRGYFEAD